MIDKRKCVFFYGGVHSQWYSTQFKYNGITFNCAEQFMMYGKALCFGDSVTAKKIMETTDPREQKALGREVDGYDDKVWEAMGYNVVLLGTFLKAIQNDAIFYDYVDNFNRGKNLYVEASPYDKRWGIGLSVADATVMDVSAWNGDNLLGKAITEVSNLLVSGSGYDIYRKLNDASAMLESSSTRGIDVIFE